LVDGSDPLEIAKAFKDNYDFESLYIADIDALTDSGSNTEIIEKLSDNISAKIMVDQGFSKFEGYEKNMSEHVDRFIVASESLESWSELDKLSSELGDTEIVFSIDILEGQVKTKLPDKNVQDIFAKLDKKDIKSVIILDISQVGTNLGPSNRVIESVKQSSYDFNFISGGGVRNKSDYKEFVSNGVEDVLVATALHNGKLKSV